MDAFERALRFTLRWEGGHVNDPADPGGETKYGISRRAYPNVDIAALTEDAAAAIYRRDYWDRMCCDDLPSAVAVAAFDAAVNCGVGRSAQWLQALVGAKPDGEVGPKTISRVSVALAGNGEAALAAALIDRRDRYYHGIVQSNPRLEKFLRGWLRRTSALRSELGLEVEV